MQGVVTGHAASQTPRFARAKFRPTALPATLVIRSALHDWLAAGAGKRLTVVMGSAGAGKSVLLSSWAAARPAGATSWLSCDKADADPVRFWTGFIEAFQAVAPGFGADAADLLTMDRDMSADVIASIANDAAKLPAASAVVVDDFHAVGAGVFGDMTDLVERWPARPPSWCWPAGWTPRCGCTGCGWRVSCASSATMTCISPWPRAAPCWPTSASRSVLPSLRCFITAARDGPRHCRWQRCRCAAPPIRCGPRGHWRSVATRWSSTSSPKFSSSSRPRSSGSCSTRPSWGT